MEVITDVRCPVCNDAIFVRGFPDDCIAFDEDSKEMHVCVGSEISGAFCCGDCRNKDLNLMWVKGKYLWALMDNDADDYHYCPSKIGRTNREIDAEIKEEKIRPSMGFLVSNNDIKRIQSWLTKDLFYELFISQKKQFLNKLFNTKANVEKSIILIEKEIIIITGQLRSS